MLIGIDTRDPLVGSTLDGRFEILAPLGKGGMGVVYRAKQLSIGRDVAIKVLDQRIESDVASIKRFFREAKVASTLAHPNTVPIVDFGQSKEGRLYLVMELVRGRTLHEEISRVGALPLARCVTIGIQLCDALEVAHGMSIVHRDLKLENVMLLDLPGKDHVKILDFGLARALTDPSMQHTATGMISGTPRYMPPEVGLEAAAPAPPQDMYSIGVILAELALGRALWVAPTMEALFMQKAYTDKSIVDVPVALKPIVRALLAHEPDARPTAIAARDMLRMIDNPAPRLQLELEESPPRAAGTGARIQRARSPLALDATADFAATSEPFANLSLVALDELDTPAKPEPAAFAPPVPAPTMHVGPPGTLADPFAAPNAEPQKLELDRAYLTERSMKLQARRVGGVTVNKRRSRAPLVVALLFMVAAIGGALALYFFEKQDRGREVAGGGVTIEIKADRPTRITVDGKAAGSTPTSLKLKKATKPILIEGENVVPQQVVPDRDQTIRLVPGREAGGGDPGPLEAPR